MLLNAENIVVLTHDVHTPPFLATEKRTETYNLAAMLTAAGTQLKHIDLEYHLQQTLILFYANRSIQLPQVFNIFFFPLAPFSAKSRLTYFHPSWFQAAKYEAWSSHEKAFVQW